MSDKKQSWLRRFIYWFFRTGVNEIPEGYGEPMPPELEKFDSELDEIQHEHHTDFAPNDREKVRNIPSKPASGR